MDEAPLPPAPRRPRRTPAQRSRTGRPPSLTTEEIVDAAIAVVDADGLDALTMRAVADRLGVGAASLYAHVANKEALVEFVVDRAIGEIDLGGPPAPESWREQVTEMSFATREMWARHRDLARASFARIPLGEGALRGIEWLIGAMRAGGLSDRVVGLGGDLIALYVGAVAYEDSFEADDDVTPEAAAAFVAGLRDFFAALPPERFPNLVELADALTSGDGDDRFAFGLDVILSGLEAISAREDR